MIWITVAFILGTWCGVFLMALLAMASDNHSGGDGDVGYIEYNLDGAARGEAEGR
jgi:hypothetical protein